MAVGDTVSGMSSISAAAYLDIQPGSGVEWVIHNVYYAGAVEFYFYDGTNEIKFDSDTVYGARLGAIFHCTNSYRLRIKNVEASAIYIGYDGIQIK